MRLVHGLLGLLLLCAPLGAGADEYVNDPLTDPSFAGRGMQGGSIAADGWTSGGETDSFWYSIPDALESGSITFTVRGLSLASTLTGFDHDIFTLVMTDYSKQL